MKSFRVLIVDDEQEFVVTLVKRLQKRGVCCAGTFSGIAALELVKEQYFDVVLLDMKMPDLDGNKVLQCIKTIKPDLPVVILSGHASVADGKAGLANGAYDYLMKPVEFDSLLEKLLATREKSSRGSPDPEVINIF
ncbi:MAG: response regulator [Proteobacteria bacterium]|nr:response regulator [Pseudomonadota bacterium]MBU1714812.1 response regulator [Pseudomonadota bacterium]